MYHRTELRFFAREIEACFEYRPHWYGEGEVRGLVLEYYTVLRSVLRGHPLLRRCLKRCRHCGIFFLTHPRNASRQDLRCPFGCREWHRKRSSAERSTSYYRRHPDEKRRHNRNRYLHGAKSAEEVLPAARASRSEEAPSPIVKHVRMVVSLIEGRQVSFEEIGEMLASNWRQRPMVRRRRVDYVVERLNKDPP